MLDCIWRLSDQTDCRVDRASEFGRIRNKQLNRPFAGLECAKLTYILLIDLFYGLSIKETEFELQYPKLRQTLDYYDQHYHRVVTLEEVADIASCTPQYVCLLLRIILIFIIIQ